MAMVKCRDCRQLISSNAPTCPHCGNPQKKKSSGCSTVVAGVAGFIVICVVISTCNSGDKPATTPSAAAPTQLKPPAEPIPAPAPTNPPAVTTTTPAAIVRTPEPQWASRHAGLVELYRAQFKGKHVGEEIKVALADGRSVHGVLAGIGADCVILQTSNGVRNIALNDMSEAARQMFFADYVAAQSANSDIEQEQAVWRAHRAREDEEIAKREAAEQAERDKVAAAEREARERQKAAMLAKLTPEQRKRAVARERWENQGSGSLGSLTVGAVGLVSSIRVVQIIDSDTMLVKIDDAPERTVLMEGRSTYGMVDNASYRLGEPFWVSGTRTYTTLLGSRTTYVVEPLSDAAR